MKKKILLTGAAGRISRAFLRYEGAGYSLRLADINTEPLLTGPLLSECEIHDAEIIQLNTADLDACYSACEGIDTVVHLAADPSPRADFYESLLDNNIKGTYNIFRAAKDQGCRRVIWASSVQAVDGYPMDVQVQPEMPPKPMNVYGVTKVFGEALAHYFAYSEGLSSIAIRVGAFEYNRDNWDEQPDARTLATFLGARDMSHLLRQCIEVDDLPFAVLQAVSDNRFKRLDIRNTRELVGYTPVDDAFQRFNTGIEYRDSWYNEQETRTSR